MKIEGKEKCMISFTNELELTLQRETMQWSAVCQLDTSRALPR